MNELTVNDVVSEEIQRYGFSQFAKIEDYNVSCPQRIPSNPEYFAAISWYGIALVTVGVLAVIIIFYMFIDTVRYIIENAPSGAKAHSIFIIGIYPVIAGSTLCATIVPRSQLLAEAVTQGTFMVGMYQLFCLIIAYCGGEAEVMRKVKPALLDMKVGPCCCWPCCCLPSFDITKNRIRYLRILVLQLPIVQGLVYMTLLLLWAERESLYQVNYVYVQPVIIASILVGVWGMTMTINLLKDILKDYKVFSKFLCMKMVLLVSKLQNLVMKIIVWSDAFPCYPPITPTLYANMIYNGLLLFEIVLLAYFARKIYKSPLPNNESVITIAHVCNIKPVSAISATIYDGKNNTGFSSNEDLRHYKNDVIVDAQILKKY